MSAEIVHVGLSEIPLDQIVIGDRARTDYGDLTDLADFHP